jgi:hypothetical protein
VTIIAVEGPKRIRAASDIPKLTDTKPVLGSGTEKLSARKIRTPNRTTPTTEILPNR